MCPVLDGTFRIQANDVVEVLSAPTSTIERLRELRDSIEQAKAFIKLNPERALAEVEQIEPTVARTLRGLSTSDRIAALSAILSALNILVALWITLGSQPQPDQVQRVVVNVFNQWSVPYDTVVPDDLPRPDLPR